MAPFSIPPKAPPDRRAIVHLISVITSQSLLRPSGARTATAKSASETVGSEGNEEPRQDAQTRRIQRAVVPLAEPRRRPAYGAKQPTSACGAPAATHSLSEESRKLRELVAPFRHGPAAAQKMATRARGVTRARDVSSDSPEAGRIIRRNALKINGISAAGFPTADNPSEASSEASLPWLSYRFPIVNIARRAPLFNSNKRLLRGFSTCASSASTWALPPAGGPLSRRMSKPPASSRPECAVSTRRWSTRRENRKARSDAPPADRGGSFAAADNDCSMSARFFIASDCSPARDAIPCARLCDASNNPPATPSRPGGCAPRRMIAC